MENIRYIDEKIANNRVNMLVFDLNTPKFANFLVALGDVLSYKNTSLKDADAVAHHIIRNSCRTKRLFNNFYNTNKDSKYSSIYRDYDGKLVVYTPGSYSKGIQYSKTNEQCINIVAKTIKQLSYNKFVYDILIKFTNDALAETNAKFDDMRSKNNGNIVVDETIGKAKFSKTLTINNATLEFVSSYRYANYYKRRELYRYDCLNVLFTCDKDNNKCYSFMYNNRNNCYEDSLGDVLDKLDFGDDFKNEWNAENKNSSIFNGFTIGEVYNIYCLMVNKKNAVKKMSDEVKNEYIIHNQGLNPIEKEIYYQFILELNAYVNKSSNELVNLSYLLQKKVKDVKVSAQKEMAAAKDKAIEEYYKKVDECNKMLVENGFSLRVTKEAPMELSTKSTYF